MDQNSEAIDFIDYTREALKEKIILHEFNIDRKIMLNNSQKVKGLIDLYKIYCSKITRIYSEFDMQGKNKSLSVFNKLSLFYAEKLLNDGLNEKQIFLKIINRTVTHIRMSQNYRELPDKELEQCVSRIVLDLYRIVKKYSFVRLAFLSDIAVVNLSLEANLDLLGLMRGFLL